LPRSLDNDGIMEALPFPPRLDESPAPPSKSLLGESVFFPPRGRGRPLVYHTYQTRKGDGFCLFLSPFFKGLLTVLVLDVRVDCVVPSPLVRIPQSSLLLKSGIHFLFLLTTVDRPSTRPDCPFLCERVSPNWVKLFYGLLFFCFFPLSVPWTRSVLFWSSTSRSPEAPFGSPNMTLLFGSFPTPAYRSGCRPVAPSSLTPPPLIPRNMRNPRH